MEKPAHIDDTQPVVVPPMPEGSPPDKPDTGATVPLAIQNTTPIEVQDDMVDSFGVELPPPVPPAKGKKRLPYWTWVVYAILFLFLVAAISAFSGYRSGIRQRLDAQALAVAQSLSAQFQLAQQDMDAGRYDIAVQRFEYIIQNDPTFPGAIDRMTEAKMAMSTTATPTLEPFLTQTPSPTPDMRGQEDMFNAAKASIDAKDWSTAIDTLLNLRKASPEFKAARVDGMLYIAFRNRGAQKILQEADLEGGTYDLSMAEKLGPLDAEANSYRSWVSLYVTGASFWDLDWKQAAYYFGQLAPLAPNLRDASGWTATQRYQIALASYGDALSDKGEYCAAVEQYNLALNYGVAIQPTVAYAQNQCTPPTAETPVPTP